MKAPTGSNCCVVLRSTRSNRSAQLRGFDDGGFEIRFIGVFDFDAVVRNPAKSGLMMPTGPVESLQAGRPCTASGSSPASASVGGR